MSPLRASAAASSFSQLSRSSVQVPLRKGAWTQVEDDLLKRCIEKHGVVRWSRVPQLAGLNRCRKSCRLRWLNYLDPRIRRGQFDEDEDDLIVRLHKLLGNRWSLIAGRLPGRTANDVKNYWNSHLSKKLNPQGKKVRACRNVAAPTRPQPRKCFTRTSTSVEEQVILSESRPSADKENGAVWQNYLSESRPSADKENGAVWQNHLRNVKEKMEGLTEATYPSENMEGCTHEGMMQEGISLWDNLIFEIPLWS